MVRKKDTKLKLNQKRHGCLFVLLLFQCTRMIFLLEDVGTMSCTQVRWGHRTEHVDIKTPK
jgi:hypothetical protein